jgi:hypothetical protein
MKKMIRFAVLAIALFSAVAVVPTAQAMIAPIGDCPTVEISTDGGQTWSECDNWGRWEDSSGVTCYYTCYY